MASLASACGGSAEDPEDRKPKRHSPGQGSEPDGGAGEDGGLEEGGTAKTGTGEEGPSEFELPEDLELPEGAREIRSTSDIKVFSSEEGTTVVTDSGETFTVPPSEEGVFVTNSGKAVIVGEEGEVIILDEPQGSVKGEGMVEEQEPEFDPLLPPLENIIEPPREQTFFEEPLPELPGGPPDIDYPQGDPEPQPLPPREMPAPEGRSPTELLEETKQYTQRAARIACKCEYAEFGEEFGAGPDYVDECSRYYFGSSEPPPVYQCIVRLMESTPSGDASAQCRRDAAATLSDCIDQAGCDANQRYECEEVFDATMRKNCPAAPYDLEARIQRECWGVQLPPPMLCQDGTRIHSQLVCDGNKNCPEGDDEDDQYCPGPAIFAEEDYALCRNGEAIPLNYLCDSENDCNDGWDESEEACMHQVASSGTFICLSGAPIPGTFVCDGEADCQGGEDEADCAEGVDAG